MTLAYRLPFPSPRGSAPGFTAGTPSTGNDAAQALREVYHDYGAYALVVDRNGQVTSYFSSVLNENKELSANFDANTIVETILQVMGGQEVMRQTDGPQGTMFTVAVP